MQLRSERIVTPAGVVAGVVSIEDGVIADVAPLGGAGVGAGPGFRPGGATVGGVPGQPAIDVGDRWVVPGYVDVHVHGGGGAQCNTADPEEVLAMARFHASHGTTALVATTVAGRIPDLEAAVATIASVVDRREDGAAAVLGSHLEGPFLSRERPGAMDPALFLDPDPPVADRLLSAGEGTVRMVTVAPELPGGLDLVRLLSGHGVVVSLGHSDASYEQAQAAVRAGARAATHLFNAMRPLHHREPGVIGAALDLDGVSCELICDGIHVDPAALRIAHRAKGTAGVRLITDAMQAAGMPDGEYRLGSSTVVVRAGRAETAEGGLIAGTTLTMDVAVRNAVRFLGISVSDASVMASANPARLLGLADRKGAIAAGMDADLVVLDEQLAARATMVEGRWASEAPV